MLLCAPFCSVRRLYYQGTATDQTQHPTVQGKGHITRAQFVEGYNKYFLDDSSTTTTSSGSSSSPSQAEKVVDPALDRLLAKLDPKGKDRIDYIEWSNTLTLKDVPALTRQGLVGWIWIMTTLVSHTPTKPTL